MTSDETPETLLILCCLVGAVFFLTFSFALVNAAQMTDGSVDPSDLERLQDSINAARQKAAVLGTQTRPSAADQDRLNRAQEELTQLNRRLDTARLELARLRGAAGEHLSTDKDHQELQKRLEDLRERIQQKTALLGSFSIAVDESARSNRSLLAARLAELEGQISKRRERQGSCTQEAFSLRACMSGATSLQKPLIVECQKASLILYPGGTEVLTAELPSKNPFRDLAGKPDGIVFLIRPDGFAAFSKAFELAKRTGLVIMYEPLDALARVSL